MITQIKTDPPVFESERLRVQPYALGGEIRMWVARIDQEYPNDADLKEAGEILAFVYSDVKGNA